MPGISVLTAHIRTAQEVPVPLDRANITEASVVMLVAYPVLNLIWGLVLTLDPQGRLAVAPALDPARDAVGGSLWVWGALWLVLAVVMVAGRLTGDRDRYILALAINRAAWGAWGVLVEAAVLTQPNVSYLAGVLPWFVAVACWASIRSLRAEER